MSALIELPAPTRARRINPGHLPAQAIEAPDDSAFLPFIKGRQMLRAWASLCYPDINAGDCIDVNFDRKEVRHDGFYLITIDHSDSESLWYGARRFMLKPGVDSSTELWGQEVSDRGWSKITPAMCERITIHGEILEVFKPVSKMGRVAI